MPAPFERIGIEGWRKQLSLVIKDFAGLNNILVKSIKAERLED